MDRILLIAFLVVTVMAASVLLTAETDGEDYETFTEGPFIYHPLSMGTASVIDYVDGTIEPDVVIPENVTHEGNLYVVVQISAFFEDEKFRSISIPANVYDLTYPGAMFSGPNITSITVDKDNSLYADQDGILFDHDFRELLRYPAGKEQEFYLIPDSVSTVCDYAFGGCKQMKSVMVPYGVVEIQDNAFADCSKLAYVNAIGETNWLPNSVILIGDRAFMGCRSLVHLALPDSLKLIGYGAFESTGLRYINIPWNLTSLGESAFADCRDLEYFECDDPDYGKYRTIDGVLYKYDNFPALAAYPAAKPDKTFAIPTKVVDIWPFAFSGCRYLEKVILPGTFQVVPESAFAGCESLKDINLTNIAVVEFNAFDGCTSLTEVKFGNILTSVENLAFARTGLKELVIPASANMLYTESFGFCDDLVKVTISEGSSVRLDYGTFLGSLSLEDIFIDSDRVLLDDGSLNVGAEVSVTVNVTILKDYKIPGNAVTDDNTTLNIIIKGERPYPIENLVGVIVCLLILIFLMRMIGGV